MGKLLKGAETADAVLSIAERIGRWIPLVSALGVGGFFTWLAAITAWLNQYGPLAWWAVGLLAALVVVALFALWEFGRLQMAKRQFTKDRQAIFPHINPLDTVFERRRINVSAFSSPFLEPAKDKVFDACELYGPATVFFHGSDVRGCGFTRCDMILVNDNAEMGNITRFKRCAFRNCKFYNLTIIVPESLRADFERGVPGIQWVNDRVNLLDKGGAANGNR